MPLLERTIDVDIVPHTWLRHPPPPELRPAYGPERIDLGQAFHMLGTLTMPDVLSAGSPALFWAWLRYFLAPAQTRELRITMEFADLDPHQKAILSDDFGVAIAIEWLSRRFGGFVEIVDGRRFMLQFAHLLRVPRRPRAKVGAGKAPDFVMRDRSNRWHVLECKGTQFSRDYQRRSLDVAIQQKRALEIAGTIRGEQLATALFIASERKSQATHLLVIDPEPEPLITLNDFNSEEMNHNARQLSIARALGVIGLTEMAAELSLPPEAYPGSGLLRPSEAHRLHAPRSERLILARNQLRARSLRRMERNGLSYDGREAQFEIPFGTLGSGVRRVTVRQGVRTEIVEDLSSDAPLAEGRVRDMTSSSMPDKGIILNSDGSHLSLTYGDIFFSELIWA